MVVLEKVFDFKAKLLSPKVGKIYALSTINGTKHKSQKEKAKIYLK